VPKAPNSPSRLSVAGLAAINVQRNEEFLASWSTCKWADRSRPPWSCLPDTLLVAVGQPWAPPLAGPRQQLPAQLALQAVAPDVQRVFAVTALRAWQRLPEAARAMR